MKLRVKYYVKFRAFFVTFGTISGERAFNLNLPTIPIPIAPFKVSDRGLDIEVSITQ